MKDDKNRVQEGHSSTPPPPAHVEAAGRTDLLGEREAFVRSVLRKGVEFTEELLSEHQELRQQNSALREENAQLRSQLASDGAIRELLQRIDRLEVERKQLLEQSTALENSRKHYEGRSHQVEQELNDLASLYVACYQLCGASDAARAMSLIGELLEQLVGVGRHVMYFVDEVSSTAEPIAWSGHGDEVPCAVDPREGALAQAFESGTACIHDEGAGEPLEAPLAVVPLVAGSQVVAIIVVEAFLPHKTRWASVDAEMLRVLSTVGATVLLACGALAKGETAYGLLVAVRTRHLAAQSLKMFARAAPDKGL